MAKTQTTVEPTKSAVSCATMELTKRSVEAAQPRVLEDGTTRQKLYFDTRLRGFGVCVGTTTKTYFVQGYVKGRSTRPTIGRHGVLTVEQARKKALKLLAQLEDDIDPTEEKRKQRVRGFTLREALELYLGTLKATNRSARTIDGYKYVIEKYLKDWLDRPLAEITRDDAHRRHQKIATDIGAGRYAGEYSNGRKRKRREGQGRSTADAVMVAFRAIWNRALRAHPELPVCPTINVDLFRVKREKTELPLSRLHEWHKHVLEIENPIRRDYLLFALHTGLRRGDGTTTRWEHVDFKRGVLRVPHPKGGEERAFELPLTDYLVKLLKTRKKENDEVFEDSPWVFPAVSAKNGGHIAEPREEFDGIQWKPHDTRRWFQRAAESLDVSPYAIKLLVNHKLPGGDVTAKYLDLELERLRPVMEAIAAKLRELCKHKRARATR